MSNGRVLDRLRQPEYTGANRCWPCTAANACIAVVGATAVGALAGRAGLGVSAGAATAGAVLAVSAAAIYLRGYLVPGTPALTKRYFPDWLLRRFDKGPGDSVTGADVDRERVLREAGVVTDCERVDDLCLTDRFRRAWRDRIEAARGRDPDATGEALAQVVGATAGTVTVERFDDGFVARAGERRIGQWESEAAYLADVAAARILRDRVAEWDRLPVPERGQLLGRLRVFLEQCPACDGPVEVGQEVVESCCRSVDVVAVSCGSCGARLFEAEQPE